VSKTLLLADDSLTIQRVVDLTFAQEDVRVVSFGNGDQAVKWMEGEMPDIVLADVGMPQPDGYALAQHMKQSERLRDVPVLLLTGAFEPLDDDKARESACDGVLVKPFEPQHLVARVAELLSRHGAGDTGAHRDSIRPDAVEAAPEKSAAVAEAPLTAPTLHLVEPVPSEPDPEPFDLEASFALDLAALDGALEWVDPAMPSSALEVSPVNEPAPLDLASEAVLEPLTPIEPLGAESWDLELPASAGIAPALSEPVPDETAESLSLVDGEFVPELSPAIASPSAHEFAGAAPEPPPVSAALPPVSLASAFSALLAAEQAHPPSAAGSAGPALTEAAIEDIVRRVLVRVTDEMVRNVVLDAAERLIKAEIDKIKEAPEEPDETV